MITIVAFTSLLSLLCVDAFTLLPTTTPITKSTLTKVNAEGGAPQYDKIDGKLREAEVLAKDSVMLHIDTTTEINYEPGHVIALEIEGVEASNSDKTTEDMKVNGGWMRGPYTISRSTDKSLDILIKVVGDKSKRFADAAPDTPVKFGGKFKVPILEGIEMESSKKIVLISTGVGVGPCVGAIEKALSNNKDDSESPVTPPIELIASYRSTDDIIYQDLLDSMKKDHAGKFDWKAVISSEGGRLSASETNLNALVSDVDAGLEDTHYHLIGNGQMVNEFKEGLSKAGVSESKVTIEMYFNHKADVDAEVVDRIANFVTSKCAAPVASS